MGESIAIPTLGNEPHKLHRLLRKLIANRTRYGHTYAIYVFDHSVTSSAHSVVKQFDEENVHYLGHDQRAAFIGDLSDRLSLDGDILNRTFSRGYGGNRNFILAKTIRDRVISIDDDIDPVSFRLVSDMHEQPTGNVIGFFQDIPAEEGEFYDFDLFGNLMDFLGKHKTQIDLREGESLDDVTNVTIDGDFHNSASRVIAVHPMISGVPDLVYPLLRKFEGKKRAFSYLEPAVVKHRFEVYQCYASENEIASVLPFIPTPFRCEDTLHAMMLSDLQVGCFVMSGNDVYHDQDSLDNIGEEEVFREMIAHLIGMHIGYLFRDNEQKLDGFPYKLRVTSNNYPYMNLLARAGPKLAILKGYNVASSRENIARIHSTVRAEASFAADTFQAWNKVRDYLMNQ